jgi:hypothetical protein
MKTKVLLYGLIWVLILVTTTMGIFYRTQGARIEYVTVRGEHAVLQGSGLYQYDPLALAREGVIWDVINLFIGLPLFAIAGILAVRRSLRGQLMLGGFLCYFVYVYLMYAMMMSLNPLFLVYVAIFSLSALAFLWNLQGMDISHLPAQISSRFPRRLFAGYTFALSAALIVLWGKLIISITLANRFPDELAGMTTLETQALDLGMIVPLALAAGILLWRRSPWGYFLTGISVTHGMMMFITIPTWIAVPLIQSGEINLFEAIPFLILCLVGLFFTGWFYWNVQQINGNPTRGSS